MTTTRYLRCLSVLQPWASAIILGPKTVENRTWPPSYTGPVGIHASKGYDRDGADEFIASRGVRLPDFLPRGAILGVVHLNGAHQAGHCPPGPWCRTWGMPGQWHWSITDPVAFAEPIPCKGALGLWTPPAAVLAAIDHHLQGVA